MSQSARHTAVISMLVYSLGLYGCGGSGGAHPPRQILAAVKLDTAKSVSPASISVPPMPHPRTAPAMASARQKRSAIQSVGWIRLPGTMSFVAASPDGSLWGLGPDATNTGDKLIYHYVDGTWTYAQGAAARLAVGPDGTPWAVTVPGGIYTYQNGSWNAVAGGANDITVGADGSPYVISNQGSNQYGTGIWQFAGGAWTQLPGAGVRIAASWDTGTYPGGIVPRGYYVLNALGSIYYYDPSSRNYSALPGTATEIAPTKNGGLFMLSYPRSAVDGNAISYEDLESGISTAQPGAAFIISTNSSYVYVIGRGNAIYQSSIVRGPLHVQNWAYACYQVGLCVVDQNVGISPSWTAANIDWNEVGDNRDDSNSSLLASYHAKHVIVYTDPNISPGCPIVSTGTPDFAEDGRNCDGPTANHLTAQNGSYAHAYQHQRNGNRLTQKNDDRTLKLYGNLAFEPFFLGDPDLQNAFQTQTARNQYATDVFEDDAGGSYNCIADYNAQCNATTTFGGASYAPPLCDYQGGYWCYAYGETAFEWDRAQQPQQAYLNDAIALSNHSAHPIIGNNGVATDSSDLQWAQSPKVEGVMSEGAWTNAGNLPGWVEGASHILQYHQLHKYVVEYLPDGNTGLIYFAIASHWIVYDPAYSIEALVTVNNAATSAGAGDTTWPEESIVPSVPLVAAPVNNDVTAFQASPGVFVREYQSCAQAGTFIGRCAAIVNINGTAAAVTSLRQSYGRRLVRNMDKTWAAGGTPNWSPMSMPPTVASHSGLIISQ